MSRITRRAAAAALLFATGAAAFESNAGGAADATTSWGLGARGEALGRAYGPLADDAGAIYWNAAGLAYLTRDEVAFAYGQPYKEIGGVSVGDAAVAKPLLYAVAEEAGGAGSLGTLGAAVAFRRVSGIPEADADGLTGRTFADADVDFYIAYAHTVGKKGALGLTLKDITRTVAGYDDSGFGLDLAAHYRPFTGVNVGAVLRNLISPSYELYALRDAPPLTLELGAAWRPLPLFAVTAAGELTRETFYDAGGGVEVSPVKYVALRGGYALGDGRPRAGLGLKFGDFHFDYALRFGGDLGDCHLASVAFLFGGPPAVPVDNPEGEGYINENGGEGKPGGEPPPLIPGIPGFPGVDDAGGEDDSEAP
jgi:hypothetical protein